MSFIRIFLIVLIIITSSCKSQKVEKNNNLELSSSNYNSEFNSEYFESVGTEYGVLEKQVYEQIKTAIESELSTTIPKEKAILINFRQNGKNCYMMKDKGELIDYHIKRGAKISSRISSKNKAIDFYVFAKNNFYNDRIKLKKNFIIDSGFFYSNIFTEHDNCYAFLILKPNGEFMKYYGEDYFTKAKDFLQKD